MEINNKRLQILTPHELHACYSIPFFNSFERKIYFALNALELSIAKTYSSTVDSVHFILQLGYCKAKNKIFNLKQQVPKKDSEFIYNTYFPTERRRRTVFNTSKDIKISQRKKILKLLNLSLFKAKHHKKLSKEAVKLTKSILQPKQLFHALLDHLENQSILIPGYSTLQDIISSALTEERKRLARILKQNLTKQVNNALNKILNQFDVPIHFAKLKQEPTYFNYKSMKQEIKKHKALDPLFQFASQLVPKLGVSKNIIRYYADLIDYYTVYNLCRLENNLGKLYLLCYIFDRYKSINNNLSTAFYYHVNNIQALAKKASEEEKLNYFTQYQEEIIKSAEINSFFIDPTIAYRTQIGYLKAKLFKRFPKEEVLGIINHLKQSPKDKLYYLWNNYDKLSQQMKLNLRQIFLHLEFKENSEQTSLFKAIHFLKEAFIQQKSLSAYPPSAIPTELIPNYLRPYLFDTEIITVNGKNMHRNKLNVNKYEFFIYQKIVEQLENFRVTIKDSTQFIPFEDELFPYEIWKKEKTVLLEQLGLPRLKKSGEETLAEFETILETLYIEVNEEIAAGKNKHFKHKKGERKWSLPYEKIPKEENDPFFSELPKIDILSYMQLANEQMGYMSVFKHRLYRDLKKPQNIPVIMLAILARANNLGKNKMADSCDFTYDELNTADAAYVYKSNLIDACNAIIDAIIKLPAYKNFQIHESLVYSSSDGTKIETHFCTIRSRFSSKYFGFARGICAYRLNSDGIPTNTFIIAANMAEHSFVYVVTFNHNAPLHSHFHTTDTAGVNKVNYVILYFKNTDYIPRYRDIYDTATNKLAGFKELSCYENYIVKPIHQIKKANIIKHWDFIQYYNYCVITKDINPHTLIHKLNKTETGNEELEALWEFNRVLESIHILRCIKDINYRRIMQKVLNRGEASNKTYRNIRSYRGGKLHARTDREQDINHLCTHLIEVIILYMNTYLLSKYIKIKEQEGDRESVEHAKNISPNAWSHLIFHGHFSFNQNYKEMFEELLRKLTKIKKKDKK